MQRTKTAREQLLERVAGERLIRSIRFDYHQTADGAWWLFHDQRGWIRASEGGAMREARRYDLIARLRGEDAAEADLWARCAARREAAERARRAAREAVTHG